MHNPGFWIFGVTDASPKCQEECEVSALTATILRQMSTVGLTSKGQKYYHYALLDLKLALKPKQIQPFAKQHLFHYSSVNS